MSPAGAEAADVVAQASRTAEWLSSVPLARLAADDARLAEGAYDLVREFDRLTRTVCGTTGGEPGAECPPPDVVPPRLAPHAAGVQVRVFADQFARAVELHGVAPIDPADLRELAARCLALRT
ncbi:MAG: hypothetical protein QG597_2496 [Actinomycetota bacterium]|nr:hypothetical protein [Actinomycetota bacterium]